MLEDKTKQSLERALKPGLVYEGRLSVPSPRLCPSLPPCLVTPDLPDLTQRTCQHADTPPILHRNAARLRLLFGHTMQHRHLLYVSTRKLQDDMQNNMRRYRAEKAQLQDQLASLRNQQYYISSHRKHSDSSNSSPATHKTETEHSQFNKIGKRLPANVTNGCRPLLRHQTTGHEGDSGFFEGPRRKATFKSRIPSVPRQLPALAVPIKPQTKMNLEWKSGENLELATANRQGHLPPLVTIVKECSSIIRRVSVSSSLCSLSTGYSEDFSTPESRRESVHSKEYSKELDISSADQKHEQSTSAPKDNITTSAESQKSQNKRQVVNGFSPKEQSYNIACLNPQENASVESTPSYISNRKQTETMDKLIQRSVPNTRNELLTIKGNKETSMHLHGQAQPVVKSPGPMLSSQPYHKLKRKKNSQESTTVRSVEDSGEVGDKSKAQTKANNYQQKFGPNDQKQPGKNLTPRKAESVKSGLEEQKLNTTHRYTLPEITLRPASKSGEMDRLKSMLDFKPTNPVLSFANTKKVTDTTLKWKALYMKIMEPEKRFQMLADIIFAVRARMRENEHQLKFGESPESLITHNTLCDFLLFKPQQKQVKPIPKKVKLQPIPTHTAVRSERRSNAAQLRGYLQRSFKARPMIEHLAAEEYRQTHYGPHRYLLDDTEQ